MRILEITRLYYPSMGGMEKHIYDRTKIYEHYNYPYNIISTDLNISHQDNSIPVKNVVYLNQYTPYNIIPSLHRYLTDEYDIISVNSIGRHYSHYAINHYSKRGKIIILTPYLAFHTQKYGFIKKIIEKRNFNNIFNKVDGVVCLSEYERDYWVTKYGISVAKTFVIPPYIIKNVIAKESSPNIDGYLLYLGRAGINKKTDLLLQVYLLNKDIKIPLRLTIREEDIDPSIRKKVVDDNRIQLLGYVSEEEKKYLLAECEAVIFPTSLESFGYVAFEASQYRKPLLCSDLPVFKELLNPNGVLYFNNTIASMSETIKIFGAKSYNEKQSMGSNNYNNLEKYTFDSACSKYEELFNIVMTRRNGN